MWILIPQDLFFIVYLTLWNTIKEHKYKLNAKRVAAELNWRLLILNFRDASSLYPTQDRNLPLFSVAYIRVTKTYVVQADGWKRDVDTSDFATIL